MKDFNTALMAFLNDSQAKVDNNDARYTSSNQKTKLETMEGKKYIRIVAAGITFPSRSAWAFIDKSNGDVLKAASWQSPAKHARANIFNPDSWRFVDCYGPAYLR